MKKNVLAVAVMALVALSPVVAQDVSTITEQETARLLKTLSADEMQGRASFTPGIEKAANFIQEEFKKIGLKPLSSASPAKGNPYRQSFTVFRLTPISSSARLGNEDIAPENMFVSTAQETLNWQQSSDRQVILIQESDNFRQAFMQANASDQDALILVHPKHSQSFQTYKNYFGKGGIKQGIGKGSSKVVVLTGQSSAQEYKVAVQNQVEKLPLFNVAGMIEGKRKDEFVVFSGHYDHIGILKAMEGDSIANGADDDASGTTAMIMLAKHFKKQRKPNRTLLFVAFTAEEIGGYGSRYFSEQLNPDQIMAMFNIEMIGKASKFGPNSAYMTGFDKSDLGTLLQNRLQGTAYSIHSDPYPEQNLFYRSDNATLARLGVPAHTISSVQIDQDKTYHSVKDEFGMLDMAHMTSMIKAIALAAQGVVDGSDTPSRVDKAQVRQ
ncbi:M20/M25/M40 family metallo-hydrolase [Pontibacter sp. SGAir0037]|uniref:M20/M25/M40 family metallo-hydrolase n=1 Tax=Pontibacter sp. SGAir0037 TaxID=2571030 RepID=UPI0010CD22BD|nr:M20/M25/M40 family metallo-hydrolase [Pontibacter sp. SGAir0037]QCR23232.1 peptidase M28 [Pontibacter sp. SGAir0037]